MWQLVVLIQALTERKGTAEARVPRLVRCETCPHEYVYQLKRSREVTTNLLVHGFDAQQSATSAAQRDLFHALLAACEPVPCPECGHVQEHMRRRARRLKFKWIGDTAIALFVTGVIAFVPATIASGVYEQHRTSTQLTLAISLWTLVGLCVVGAVAMGVWRVVAPWGYDPNAEDVEARKRCGRELAVSRAEYESSNPGALRADVTRDGPSPTDAIASEPPRRTNPDDRTRRGG
jgi:hypothetical protein